MAGNNAKRVGERIAKVIKAWEDLRPNKTFAGMTLADAKTALKPSSDARVAIATLENQMIAATDQRDAADVQSVALVALIVNGVKADATEGENGELYEAMGYVRKSERKSGLSRKKNATPAPTPA